MTDYTITTSPDDEDLIELRDRLDADGVATNRYEPSADEDAIVYVDGQDHHEHLLTLLPAGVGLSYTGVSHGDVDEALLIHGPSDEWQD